MSSNLRFLGDIVLFSKTNKIRKQGKCQDWPKHTTYIMVTTKRFYLPFNPIGTTPSAVYHIHIVQFSSCALRVSIALDTPLVFAAGCHFHDFQVKCMLAYHINFFGSFVSMISFYISFYVHFKFCQNLLFQYTVINNPFSLFFAVLYAI